MVSATPSSVEDEGSVVLWHPGHCGAISAASALEVMLEDCAAFSLIVWRPTVSDGCAASGAAR